jgi:hypothetical protein
VAVAASTEAEAHEEAEATAALEATEAEEAISRKLSATIYACYFVFFSISLIMNPVENLILHCALYPFFFSLSV